MSNTESPPADANPEASQHVPSSLASELEAVRDVLASHSQRLDELVRIGGQREDLIDRLHEENQRLRAGEVVLVQAPPIRELIRTYDLVLQLLAESGNEDLDLVRRRLMDAFEQVGVRIVEPADGEAFDHDHHLAVDTMPTALEEEHMTVVTTGRPGFVRIGGEVVRPADVRVRRYKPADHVDESSDGAGRSREQ
jgi:molecular chaperone GrpE (heat shock protein)